MNTDPFISAPFPVVGWGAGWVAVDKPAGLSVHNLPGQDLCSLMTRHVQENTAAADLLKMGDDFGLHAVHRLDRETSGVVLLAARRSMFRFLSGQFASGQVTKFYLAVLHGRLSIPAAEAWQRWTWPLAPKAAGRRNPLGNGRRQAATTLLRVVHSGARYSLVQCQPITGRTHQIRRHAVLAGHAVVGDKRYGSMRAVRYLQKNLNFSRLALHAAELVFRPSADEEAVGIQSRGLPLEMQQLMERESTDGHPKQH